MLHLVFKLLSIPLLFCNLRYMSSLRIILNGLCFHNLKYSFEFHNIVLRPKLHGQAQVAWISHGDSCQSNLTQSREKSEFNMQVPKGILRASAISLTAALVGELTGLRVKGSFLKLQTRALSPLRQQGWQT
jgi:hypothetical protein